MKRFTRYWGYFLLLLVIVGWVSRGVGPVVLVVASIVALSYFLFWAPSWCGARTNSGGFCRNNSRGLLVGCHLRDHKWQSLKLLLCVIRWTECKEFCGRMLRGIETKAVAISALASMISAIAAVITLILK